MQARPILKRIVQGLSLVAVVLFSLLCGFGRILIIFTFFAQLLALIPGTAAGGVRSCHERGDAILVKKRDRDGLASAAAELLKDPQILDRLVSYAREIVSPKTPEAYFKSIVSVFSQTCANGN